jgi:TrpR-related protein YerC/YecD
MNENWLNSEKYNELFKVILKLKNVEECKKFFRDMCTISELENMAERFQVAKKIFKKEPYRNISQEIGSSTATVTRVAHWLNHGMGGYKLVIKRLKIKEN